MTDGYAAAQVSPDEPDVTYEEVPGEGRIPRIHQTDSGVPLKQEYTAEDWSGDRPSAGTFPFTRGNYPGMYRDTLWHRDLYSGFGNAEQAKERYEGLLRGGASGVNIALDLPTQLGYDSDDPEAAAEVGKVGLAVDTMADLEHLFSEIPLSDAKIVFTVGNGIGPIALAWFELLGESQGVSPDDYIVHLQNDPLKEFTGRGAFIFPLEAHVKLACDVVEYVANNGWLHWKPIGICGSQYRWGGATAAHEVGFALAAARVYLDELLERGLDIDQIAPLFEFHLTVDSDVFEEAAKFRAARMLWAKMLSEEYGAKDPRSLQLRVSLYTAGYRLTAQEPLNNAVRITLQALGAVLGGVEHLGTLSIDEAMSTPSEESARLAVQTQNILAYETSVSSVADPLGGSWYVESLTEELARRMQEASELVKEYGGTIKAIRDGYLQRIVQEAASEYQSDIEAGRRTVVGVNRFATGSSPTSMKAFKVADESLTRQAERVRLVREQRDSHAVEAALGVLRDSARAGDNLVPALKAAVDAMATVGEIVSEMKSVFGTWEDDGVIL